jgi:hypothetical protein
MSGNAGKKMKPPVTKFCTALYVSTSCMYFSLTFKQEQQLYCSHMKSRWNFCILISCTQRTPFLLKSRQSNLIILKLLKIRKTFYFILCSTFPWKKCKKRLVSFSSILHNAFVNNMRKSSINSVKTLFAKQILLSLLYFVSVERKRQPRMNIPVKLWIVLVRPCLPSVVWMLSNCLYEPAGFFLSEILAAYFSYNFFNSLC